MARDKRVLRPRASGALPVASAEDARVVDEPAAADDGAGIGDLVGAMDEAIQDLRELTERRARELEEERGEERALATASSPAAKFVPPPQVSQVPRGPARLILPTAAEVARLAPGGKSTKKAKRGKAAPTLTPVQRRAQQAQFMSSFRDEKRRAHGTSDILLGGETANLTVCLPCPSLAFEFLIAANGLPLSIVVHLLAKWGSGKSGFVAELFRWFIEYGGWGVLEEVESKFSPRWFRSIIGADYDELIQVDQCSSMEDWQHKLQSSIKIAKRRLIGTKGEPGLGRAHPFCFAIDSISGKMSEESQGRIDKEGSAGRTMPVEANSLSKYLKSVASWIDRWPFVVVLVNHLKDKINVEKGESSRSWSGGSLIGFQETLELEIQKYGSPINTTDADGFHVAIRCFKNSLGVTGRLIHVRILWWEEEQPGGGFEQKTVFDWDWATVKLLYNIIHGKAQGVVRLRQLLKDHDFHLDCPKISEVENVAWSRSLGMTKGDALPWSEVGRMIHANAELMKRLRLALRIHEFPLLTDDYLKHLSKAARNLE